MATSKILNNTKKSHILRAGGWDRLFTWWQGFEEAFPFADDDWINKLIMFMFICTILVGLPHLAIFPKSEFSLSSWDQFVIWNTCERKSKHTFDLFSKARSGASARVCQVEGRLAHKRMFDYVAQLSSAALSLRGGRGGAGTLNNRHHHYLHQHYFHLY